VLTQENVEKVLNALTKAMYPRDSATTQEVAREAGLLEADVEAILKQLQREGKVYSPYPSWWKMV